MRVADLAQPFQIALWRHQHAGGAGNRLDDTGGDGVGTVQTDDTLQVIGKLGTTFGLTLAEAVLGQPGVAHVRNAGQSGPEHLAILHHAA